MITEELTERADLVEEARSIFVRLREEYGLTNIEIAQHAGIRPSEYRTAIHNPRSKFWTPERMETLRSLERRIVSGRVEVSYKGLRAEVLERFLNYLREEFGSRVDGLLEECNLTGSVYEVLSGNEAISAKLEKALLGVRTDLAIEKTEEAPVVLPLDEADEISGLMFSSVILFKSYEDAERLVLEAFDYSYFSLISRHFGVYLAAAAKHSGLRVEEFEGNLFRTHNKGVEMNMDFPEELLNYNHESARKILLAELKKAHPKYEGVVA